MRALQKTLIFAPLLLLAIAVPALAQPAASYPACTNKPTAQDSEAAHSAYNLGKRFFDEADYTTAIHNFADAYKLDCTKPELLLNIARANELLGNRAEAVRALETYLQRATNATEDDKAQLQRRIDNLKALIAQQTPVVAPPPPVSTTTAVAPPPPLPPVTVEERHHTIPPWILIGIGGVAVIAGGATALAGLGDISSANSTCPVASKCNNASAVSTGNTGDTLDKAGQAVFFSGLGVVAVGVLWHFLEPTGPVNKDATKTSLVPAFAPGYAGANVLGHF
jgi:tetratricopeptide (TPR) repeat protein